MGKLSIKLNDLSPLINTMIEKVYFVQNRNQILLQYNWMAQTDPYSLQLIELWADVLDEKYNKFFSIQLLDSDGLTKQQKLKYSKEMFEVVDNMRIFFMKVTDSKNDEDVKIFVETIERIFSQFEWNSSVAVSPLEFGKFSENGKLLISSILKLLGTKGCGILIIETYLKLCLKTMFEMKENIHSKNLLTDKSNFKLLLEAFSSTATMLKKYWHISFSSDQKNTIMLCLHQICKVLPYLLKMIGFQNVNIKKYLLNLLIKCLTKIQDEIYNEDHIKPKSYGEEFIMTMDFCLYKLNELSNSTVDFVSFIKKAEDVVAALKPCIDELLCSVMTIAQVTIFQDDYIAILAGSQKVLREFSELNNQIKEQNQCAIKLNACGIGESLCSLEQKVNIAVLKLILEVFSSVNSPLKNILNKCRTDIAKDNKTSEDLNDLISGFDSEMDRIMQIGFFAISCTTSLNRILEIRSCLASLESLETELIPSLAALYVDCNTINKANFQNLFDFWLNEITELKVLIDSILDPAGFCGVVRNQIKTLGLAFKDSSSFNFCLNKFECNLKQAIRYSKKLIRTLKTSMEDENETNKLTEDYLEKFQLAVQECELVLNLLDQEQDTNKTINQGIKRYDFLMHTLDKLSSHLFFLVNDEKNTNDEKENLSNDSSFQKVQIPQKNYYALCEPFDVTPSNINEIPDILTPYVNNGILRSKKRNVFYTTSEQIEECKSNTSRTVSQTRYWDKTPISSKRSRCCKPLNLNLELENSIDLEIPTVLENISRLSTTFFKTSHGSPTVLSKADSKKEHKHSKDVACGEEKGINDSKPVFTSTGCCAKLDSDDNVISKTKGENSEDEKQFFGFELRNRFLQVLDDLSHNNSLLAINDSETQSTVDSRDRIDDLKIVEEKIKFLKTRMPLGMPQI